MFISRTDKTETGTLMTDLAESVVMISWRNPWVCKINRIVFCKKRLVKWRKRHPVLKRDKFQNNTVKFLIKGHSYKTDASLKRTPRDGPTVFQSYYSLTLYKTETYLKRKPRDDPYRFTVGHLSVTYLFLFRHHRRTSPYIHMETVAFIYSKNCDVRG